MNTPNRLQAPYRSASYLKSAHELGDLPPDVGSEVAFAGRSNSGKSSAINALAGQRALARTSKTPGRTRQLVIFRLDDERRLVDLPGYGHANVPDALRSHWQSVIDAYFHRRRSLRGVVLMMDVRHPLTDFDRQMLDWCEACGLPVHVVLTKADKLRRAEALAALSQVRAGLPASATVQLFSARQRAGIEELARRLAPWYGYDSEDSRAPGAAARIGDAAKGEHA